MKGIFYNATLFIPLLGKCSPHRCVANRSYRYGKPLRNHRHGSPNLFPHSVSPFANRREHHPNTKDSQPVTQHSGSHIFMPEHTYIIIFFLFEITVQPFTLRITEMHPGRMFVQVYADIQHPLRQAIEIMGRRRSVIFRSKRTVFTMPGKLIGPSNGLTNHFPPKGPGDGTSPAYRQQHTQQRIRSQQGTVRLGGIADPFVMSRLVQQITIVAIILKQCVGQPPPSRFQTGRKHNGCSFPVARSSAPTRYNRRYSDSSVLPVRIFGSQSGWFLSSRTQQ